MSRARVGDERVQFHLGGTSTWTGVTRPKGILWYRNGKRTAPSEMVESVWRHTTLILDPQKREGSAQPSGSAIVNGADCNRFAFTDANTGDKHEAWVDRQSGDLVRWRIVPGPQFRSLRHEFDMTLTQQGTATVIDEPK
jgi:hypothetical protein